MSFITELFNLNPPGQYNETVGQVSNMVNQYEQRRVQNRQIDSQERAQNMQAESQAQDRQMQGEQAKAALEQQNRKLQIEAQQKAEDQAEVMRHNKSGEEIDSQKANLESNKFDWQQQLDTKSDARADVAAQDTSKESKIKQVDWAQQQVDRENLSKAMQEGGVDAFTDMLGKQGRTKEYMDAKSFQKDYQRNTYLNQQTLADTAKTEYAIEGGRRHQEISDIVAPFTAMMDSNPDLAFDNLYKSLEQSQYHKGYTKYDKGTLAALLPQMVQQDKDGLSAIVSNKNSAALTAQIFKGMGDQANARKWQQKELDMQDPSDMAKQINEIKGYEASGDIEAANLAKGKLKGAPLVQVGPNGETGESVDAYGKSAQNDLQKDYNDYEQARADLANIKKNMDTKQLSYFNQSGVAAKARGNKAGVYQLDTEDKKQVAAQEQFFTPLKAYFLKYRKQITGVAGGDKEMEDIRQSTINDSLSEDQFLNRLDSLDNMYKNKMQSIKGEAGRGGIPTNNSSQTNQSTPPKITVEDLKAREQRAWDKGDDNLANQYRDAILQMDG